MFSLKSPEEIRIMREGGRILARILKKISRETRAGVSAIYLNELAEAEIEKEGGEPAFKNYEGFPASLCVSVNSEVVHGVPQGKVIREGDVVGLDLGLKYKNLHTDAAVTVVVGEASREVKKFVRDCRQSLHLGIRQVKSGHHIGDVSSAIQSFVEQKGYSVVRQLVGHGIGYQVHEEPRVPNYGEKGKGLLLCPGMTFCIEPMINMGEAQVEVKEDGHTFETADRSLSAHFEHTVAVIEKGCLILTE
ncbi:MAG: methionyl aminopeptidase [Parcubacteria group bacterium LiPW_72]|nr:MAG: methionyl aminopeptidase [Parcubacteria group bacterium LiPW_72]